MGVILLFQPHFPVFPFCFDYYLTAFIPYFSHESDIALILSKIQAFIKVYISVVFLILINYTSERVSPSP